MSKYFNTLLFVLVSIIFTSCFSSKEEIWINADGSGRMETESDMSSMYPLIAMGMASEKAKMADGEEGGKDNPLMDLMMAEEMDTTFQMKGLFEEIMAEEGMTWEQMLDSIRYAPIAEGKDPMSEDEREGLLQLFEGMMDVEMRWQISQKDQVMKSTQIQRFAKVNDLKEKTGGMMDMMKKLGEVGGDGGKEDQDLIEMFDDMSGMSTVYSLSGNKLNIKRSGMDMSSLTKGDDEMAQVLPMMKMMLGNQDYKMIVHLPGKVKKVSSKLAQIGADKKSVIIEFPMDDLFDPELDIDVDVQFKGLKK